MDGRHPITEARRCRTGVAPGADCGAEDPGPVTVHRPPDHFTCQFAKTLVRRVGECLTRVEFQCCNLTTSCGGRPCSARSTTTCCVSPGRGTVGGGTGGIPSRCRRSDGHSTRPQGAPISTHSTTARPAPPRSHPTCHSHPTASQSASAGTSPARVCTPTTRWCGSGATPASRTGRTAALRSSSWVWSSRCRGRSMPRTSSPRSTSAARSARPSASRRSVR